MEAVRHVCPAAEEDQGTRPIRQRPLEHLNLGFTLGIKENHRAGVSCLVWSLPPMPVPTSSLFSPSPQLCHRLEDNVNIAAI